MRISGPFVVLCRAYQRRVLGASLGGSLTVEGFAFGEPLPLRSYALPLTSATPTSSWTPCVATSKPRPSMSSYANGAFLTEAQHAGRRVTPHEVALWIGRICAALAIVSIDLTVLHPLGYKTVTTRSEPPGRCAK